MSESSVAFNLNGRVVAVRPEALDYHRNAKLIETGVRAPVVQALKDFASQCQEPPANVLGALGAHLTNHIGTVSGWLPESPELAARLAGHVDETAFGVFLTSVGANLVSEDVQAAQEQLAKPNLSPADTKRLYDSFLSKISEKIERAVEVYLVQSLLTGLSAIVGPVFGGMDFRSLRQQVVKNQAEGHRPDEDELAELLALFPADPQLVQQALEIYGDEDGAVSRVAEEFGLPCRPIKLAIVKSCVEAAGRNDEESVLKALAEGVRLLKRLQLDGDSDATEILRSLRSRADDFDIRFRTVGSVVYATRLEAELTRRDIRRLMEALGEDATPLLAYARYRGGAVPPQLATAGADLTGRLSDLLEEFAPRAEDSPFLLFVIRAFAHARDFGRYAGNARLDTWRMASSVRQTKAEALSEALRVSKNVRREFALDAGRFPRGVFAFFKRSARKAAQKGVVARYYGDRLPEDAHTLEGLLRWQAGFDLLDPCPESCLEISPEGLPASFVSTHEMSGLEGFDARLKALPQKNADGWNGTFALRPAEASLPLPQPDAAKPAAQEKAAPEKDGGEEPTAEKTSDAESACQTCGATLATGAHFCRKCGARVS